VSGMRCTRAEDAYACTLVRVRKIVVFARPSCELRDACQQVVEACPHRNSQETNLMDYCRKNNGLLRKFDIVNVISLYYKQFVIINVKVFIL